MDVPIYIDGAEAGRLTAAREGLYLVLRADCEMRPGLVRLWLHGQDGGAYLGLLAPEGGRLTLTRRYSRAAAAALPEFEYADNSESKTARSGKPEAVGRDDPDPPEPARSTDSGSPGAATPTAGTPLSPHSELRTPNSEFIFLPCLPTVPGAAQIGGRWVLAISPPPQYNKKKRHTGGRHHADE